MSGKFTAKSKGVTVSTLWRTGKITNISNESSIEVQYLKRDTEIVEFSSLRKARFPTKNWNFEPQSRVEVLMEEGFWVEATVAEQEPSRSSTSVRVGNQTIVVKNEALSIGMLDFIFINKRSCFITYPFRVSLLL